MKKVIFIFICFSLFSCASTTYKSECISGDCANGKGIYTWENGAKYEGSWKDGKRNGFGKYTYANGTIYEGSWKDDKKEGKGKMWVYEGKKLIGIYKGTWQNDQMHGTIEIHDENNVLLLKNQYYHGKNLGEIE